MDSKTCTKTVSSQPAQGPSLRCTDGCENDGHLGLTVVRCAETQRIPRRIAETNLSRART